MIRFLSWMRMLYAYSNDWRCVPEPNVRCRRYQPGPLSEWAFNHDGDLTNE